MRIWRSWSAKPVSRQCAFTPAVVGVATTVVLVAYLVTGLIAWQRHPNDQIGLLFTLTGYAWFLPQLLSLHYAVPFTIATDRSSYEYCTCTGSHAFFVPK